jgi:glutathione S-transferase
VSEPLLWQYNFSNFNEKVRWALDYKRIPHRRHSLMPGMPKAMRFSRQGGTVPVMDIDGRRIVDSTAIIGALEERWPDPPLYPQDPAERRRALELEDFFDENAGHEMRRVGFYEWRKHPDTAAALVTTGQSWFFRRTAKFVLPIAMKAYAQRRYRIYRDDVEKARGDIMAALDRIEMERGGRDYLVAGSFSIADLTVCSLLYPFVHARGKVKFQYDYPPLPRTQIVEMVEGHPAVEWMERMYLRHRGTSAEIS